MAPEPRTTSWLNGRATHLQARGVADRPGEIVECTSLGYALLFGGPRQRKTVTMLREGPLSESITPE